MSKRRRDECQVCDGSRIDPRTGQLCGYCAETTDQPMPDLAPPVTVWVVRWTYTDDIDSVWWREQDARKRAQQITGRRLAYVADYQVQGPASNVPPTTV